MTSTLDQIAQDIRANRLILAYSHSGAAKLAFPGPAPPELRRAIRNRRRGLARLMQSGDWRLCPAPDLHRQSWRYAGQGRYQCEKCMQLDRAQLGLWKVS